MAEQVLEGREKILCVYRPPARKILKQHIYTPRCMESLA